MAEQISKKHRHHVVDILQTWVPLLFADFACISYQHNILEMFCILYSILKADFGYGNRGAMLRNQSPSVPYFLKRLLYHI